MYAYVKGHWSCLPNLRQSFDECLPMTRDSSKKSDYPFEESMTMAMARQNKRDIRRADTCTIQICLLRISACKDGLRSVCSIFLRPFKNCGQRLSKLHIYLPGVDHDLNAYRFLMHRILVWSPNPEIVSLAATVTFELPATHVQI